VWDVPSFSRGDAGGERMARIYELVALISVFVFILMAPLFQSSIVMSPSVDYLDDANVNRITGDNEFLLSFDNLDISIISLNDSEIVIESVEGAILQWIIESDYQVNGWYTIKVDEVQVYEGEWFVNLINEYNLDTLTVGTHSIIFTAGDYHNDPYDFFDEAYTTVIVNSAVVNLPTISDAVDLTFVEGSDTSIVWTVYDDNPGVYTITEDGVTVIDGISWTSGTQIEYPLIHLSAGSHEITCHVYDVDGNSASDTVYVAVGLVMSQSYPTTSGNPLFTLNIVTAEESSLAVERAEWFAANLQEIGIECVIYPLPFSYWFPTVFNPEDYGIMRPSSTGAPQWTTLIRTPHFSHVIDEGVMWCGAFGGDAPYEEWDAIATPPGYGNGWDDILMKQFQLPLGAVSLSYSIQYDTEQNYDFVHVQISTDDGTTWETLMSLSGTSAGYEPYTHDLTDYANQQVLIRFNFISDLGVSDESGFDTEGACRIDWVDITGFPRDEFADGADGWEIISPERLFVEGFDIALAAMPTEGYRPGFEYMHENYPSSGVNQGYTNPEYYGLVDRLIELDVDWNANFPNPPYLSGEVLDILYRLQEIWIEDFPFWVLWGRDWWQTGSLNAGWPFVLPNLSNEHLEKVEVRQAINYAIDRSGMISAGLSSAPRTWLVQTPIHPWTPGFVAEISDSEYDKESAMRFLLSAGYTDISGAFEQIYDSAYSVIEVFNSMGEPDGFAIAGSTLNDNGDYDILFIRADINGNQLWNQTYGSLLFNEYARDLVQCNDGGYAIIGCFEWPDDGGSDVYFVRIYPDGTHMMRPLQKAGYYEIGNGIIELADGRFAIAASTSYQIGDWDGRLIVTNEIGDVISSQTRVIGGEEDDYLLDIIENPSGDLLLSGYTYSIGSGGADMWLVRVYPDSEQPGSYKVQEITYGGTDNDFGYKMHLGDGTLAIAGATSSHGAGGFDAWLVVTDNTGSYRWNMTYGGTGNDWAKDVVVCENGGFALGGYTETDSNSNDFWFVRTYKDGTLRWSETFGQNHDDRCESLIQTDDWGFAMVGTRYMGSGESQVMLVLVPPEEDIFHPWWIQYPHYVLMEYYYDYFLNQEERHILFSVTDDTEISHYTMTGEYVNYFSFSREIDGPVWTIKAKLAYRGVPRGAYYFTVQVFDYYGHSLSFIFRIQVEDTRPPDWIIEPEIEYFVEYGELRSFGFRVWDPSTPLSIWINDTMNFAFSADPYSGETTLFIINVLEVGSYGLRISASDHYGRSCFRDVRITVQDTTPPTLEVTDKILEYGSRLRYWIEASDMSTYSWHLIDETGKFSLFPNPTYPDLALIQDLERLPVGVYTLEVQVYDIYGNKATASFTVTVQDTSAPAAVGLLEDYSITYTPTVQIVFDIEIEDFSVISYISTQIYNPHGIKGFSLVISNSTDGTSCRIKVLTMESLEKGWYDLYITARDIYNNYKTWVPRIHVYSQLQVELSGEFDYKLKEPIQLTISAYITTSENNMPAEDDDYNVFLYNFFDSNGNSKSISPSLFEYVGRGMWLWTSDDTLEEIMKEGTLEIGVYTIEVMARGSLGSYYLRGYAYLSIHIDPPGVLEGDSSLSFVWASFSGLLIVNLAIVIVFFAKRRGFRA